MVRDSYWSLRLKEFEERKRSTDGDFSKEKLDLVKKSVRDWQQLILAPFVAQSAERREIFENASGIPLKHTYTPLDIAGNKYEKDLGLPGEYPYTRGVYPSMYRGRHWTMRMFSGFGSAEQTNKRLKYLLKEGETGLSIAFDMP